MGDDTVAAYPTTGKSNATNPKPSAPKNPTDNQKQPDANATAPTKEPLSPVAIAGIVVFVIDVRKLPPDWT